jgi:hypothetical protein
MSSAVKLRKALSTSPSWVRRGILLGVDALIVVSSFIERLLRGMEEHTPRELRDFGPARMKPTLKKQIPLMLVVALAAVAAVVIAVL